MFLGRQKIQIKTDAQLQQMRVAGLVVARTLNLIRDAVAVGVSTLDLDAIARENLKREGAQSSFLNYHGYPAVICASINEEVVHGIPSDRKLSDGDIISIDFGAHVEGWHGDSAITVLVGNTDPALKLLSEATENSMWAGMAAALVGNRLSDISHEVEKSIRAAGDYGIVEDYVGHGIGTEMHMYPSVPNFGDPGHGPELGAGMTLAIEPMVTAGEQHVELLADNWTVSTLDGKHASHWEHTVAITAQGPWVLTATDGGVARFRALGLNVPDRA